MTGTWPARAGTVGQTAPGPPGAPGAPPLSIQDWLRIEPDGVITVFTGKAEVGQNIRTSLAQAVAEELCVAVERVHLVMSDTAQVPFDRGTFGSRSTPDMSVQLRRAAAAARAALIGRAAERWESDESALVAQDGRIVHAETGQAFTYAELTDGMPLEGQITILGNDGLTPPERWRVAGTSVPKTDVAAMVTGMHHYASDMSRPGMLHGKVLRPPVYGATLVTLNTSLAETIPGVTVVWDSDFAGVVAPDARTAAQALTSLHAEWSIPAPESSPARVDGDLFHHLRTHSDASAQRNTGQGPFVAGSIEAGLRQADRILRRTYTVAYVAHAPLEPRAAVAEWAQPTEEARPHLTVWTGSQRPFGVQGQLVETFGLPPEQVRVIVPDTGSGYGGKHTGEAAIEAARLARVAGRPVKVVWTREEEFTWAYFRPAGVIDLTVGARRDGSLTAWETHNYNSGMSALRTPYEVPHQHAEFHAARSPLRQGSYRALAATANIFARESLMDELAHDLGQDPLAFRLANLREPRLRAVLMAAAERFGWPLNGRIAPGKAAGLACGTEKGGFVATCAEVEMFPAGELASPSLEAGPSDSAVSATQAAAASTEPRSPASPGAAGSAGPSDGAGVSGRRVRLIRLVTAFECGAIVNPDHLRNQVEGATGQGIGGALFEAIQFEAGRIVNPRFSQYRVPRFGDVPPIDVVLLDRKDLPSAGAGETPIAAVAPAIANAIFHASGLRRRSLPLTPDGVLPDAGG